MAHIAKYKAQSVGHMLAHYRRDRSFYRSMHKELGALAAKAQQMRTSAKQLENERSSGRPESRSKGVDR